MRSLFVRFFLSYWLIIGITIGTAAVGGYWYAERMRDAIENFELESSILDASAALESDGREGLTRWLNDFPQSPAVRIFVIDESGHDILGRRPPFGVMRSFHRYNEHVRRHRHDDDGPSNLRRARPLPQLVAANGDTFTFIVAPARLSGNLWADADARYILLIVALVISGLVSYALAKAISRPVQKLRDATVALADGDLDVRVASSIGKRRDELGMLGRDFDSMAEKLQSAVEQQTELSRNISHELRSPLARMRVAVELAKRQAGELPEFDRLEGEAERLDSLIGQILSYTRLDSGTAREPGPVDLADVISEVAENVNFECKADGIEGVSVVTKIEPLSEFDGHRDALVSAIENIVRNAVYHCPANSEVTVALSQSNERAIIEIRDHGNGVEEGDLERLFEPFFRTRKSVAADDKHGTGLGLAIAARAIQVNRGELLALNHPDGGLSVRIALPL
jgi:two-component system OmpR family sensor kinase